MSAAREHEFHGDALSALDWCYEQGWAADGLPVIPPEKRRVEAMLAAQTRPPQTVIASHPATGNQCTIEAAAINAVMAGCLPEYLPVVIAALEAMDRPEFTFHGSTASTGGAQHLLIVSGPIVEQIGMNPAGNCFGPGNRANATIGRAIRL
ncbi:MAG: TlpA family protein disulfide reductase, partial [Gammaproteobacteria bacterium]|nr:TlpA family protein disulfide reductase [Gammaproteobacteria bacterium]